MKKKVLSLVMAAVMAVGLAGWSNDAVISSEASNEMSAADSTSMDSNDT